MPVDLKPPAKVSSQAGSSRRSHSKDSNTKNPEPVAPIRNRDRPTTRAERSNVAGDHSKSGLDNRLSNKHVPKVNNFMAPDRVRPANFEPGHGNAGDPSWAHQRNNGRMQNNVRIRNNFRAPPRDYGRPDHIQHKVLSPQVEMLLEENHIAPVKKVKQRFPLAKFFCRVCDYHCDNLQVVSRHISAERHVTLKRTHDLKRTIKHLPNPNQRHLTALEMLLNDVYMEHGLMEQDLKDRLRILHDLSNALQDDFPDCVLQLYGSSLTGFGLKGSSDVNLHLQLPEKADQISIITKVYEFMRDTTKDICNDVESDFMARVPAINFVDKSSGFKCSVDISNNLAFQTSSLLSIYKQLDSRASILGTIFSLWSKLCHINVQSLGTMASYAYILMLIHFCQQCTPPILPIIDTKNPTKPDWESENKESIASLWLQLLQYYSVEFKFGVNVINIRQLEPLTLEDKNWGYKKIAIEDPYSLKRNVSRSISHSSVADFILDRIRRAYLYFGIPQTAAGPLFYTISPEVVDEDAGDLEKRKHFNDRNYSKENLQNMKDCVPIDEVIRRMKGVTLKELSYFFNEEVLSEGLKPALICRLCQKKGHLDDDCPEDKLPPLVELPPMTDEFVEKISKICYEVHAQYSPLDSDLTRSTILSDLELFIRETHPGAKLEMFGSSCNGFGFHNSDLDICLTFDGNENGEGLDFPAIVEALAERFQTRNDMSSITAIPTAKVPIVKFTYKDSKIEGDISLYNTLALRNTNMLKTYCKIDDRLQILGYSLKLFAKSCDIGAAARGSLSSYAYILMLIYFLQQRKPAVLPVLQELYTGEVKPEVIVDEWNAWHFEDLDSLSTVWEDYGKNKESVGQLWIGFFEFYAKEFNFKDEVVCIKQKERLMRLKKMWNTKCISIEDPFELNHNLGAGLSRKMNNYILKALIKGREIYGNPIDLPPSPYTFLEDYLFDPNVLTDGILPPNTRGCYVCNSNEHKVKECPKRNPRKAKRDEKNNDAKKERGYNESSPRNKNNQVGNRQETNNRSLHQRDAVNIKESRGQHPPVQHAVDIKIQPKKTQTVVDGSGQKVNNDPRSSTEHLADQKFSFPPPNFQNPAKKEDGGPLDDPAIISCMLSKPPPPPVINSQQFPPNSYANIHDGFQNFQLNSAQLPPPFNNYSLRFHTPPPFQTQYILKNGSYIPRCPYPPNVIAGAQPRPSMPPYMGANVPMQQYVPMQPPPYTVSGSPIHVTNSSDNQMVQSDLAIGHHNSNMNATHHHPAAVNYSHANMMKDESGQVKMNVVVPPYMLHNPRHPVPQVQLPVNPNQIMSPPADKSS